MSSTPTKLPQRPLTTEPPTPGEGWAAPVRARCYPRGDVWELLLDELLGPLRVLGQGAAHLLRDDRGPRLGDQVGGLLQGQGLGPQLTHATSLPALRLDGVEVRLDHLGGDVVAESRRGHPGGPAHLLEEGAVDRGLVPDELLLPLLVLLVLRLRVRHACIRPSDLGWVPHPGPLSR